MATADSPSLKTFRSGDGRNVVLRLIEPGDRDAILALARGLEPDDLLFLRTDITRDDVVDEWLAALGNGRTHSIAADVDGALAGYASLHLNRAQWTREVGEIRVVVSPQYRGLDLGRNLIGAMVDIAPELGLRKLTAQMTVDQYGARTVFERLGFRAEALLADYVTDRDGRPRDLVLMTYDLTGFTDNA